MENFPLLELYRLHISVKFSEVILNKNVKWNANFKLFQCNEDISMHMCLKGVRYPNPE